MIDQQHSKKITSFEKMFIDLNERCQLAVEVSKPDLIPKIIRNLTNYILGFHLKLEDERIIFHEKPFQVYSIPKNIQKVHDACNYVSSIQYDINKTMSVIAANDNIVAISAHHMICDGGLLVEAFDKLLVDHFRFKFMSKTPLNVCDMFSKEMTSLSKNDIEKAKHSMDYITKIKWSDNYHDLKKKLGIQSICKHS